MRVVVPYVAGMLHPRVLPGIVANGVRHPELVELDPDDLYGYARLFATLWSEQTDFVIVEQDNELPPGVLEGFEACPEWWCGHCYSFGIPPSPEQALQIGFGCVRFRAELMRAQPDVPWDAVGLELHPIHPPGSWRILDAQVFAALSRGTVGAVVHRHTPDVIHHHDYTDGPAPAGSYRTRGWDPAAEAYVTVEGADWAPGAFPELVDLARYAIFGNGVASGTDVTASAL